MDTAHTSNDNPAEIAALFAYLDAPVVKVAPVAPAAEVVAPPAKRTAKTAPVLTTTARGGITVLAKMSKVIGLMAVTYANRTQAQRKVDALGAGWHVSAQWPFLIVKSK